MKKRRAERGDDFLRSADAENTAFVTRKHEALWLAVESNDIAAAEKFLDANEVEELNMYDGTGQTMIHKAAALGYTEMLILLLERTGAKPDLVNAQLATPLHLACRSNKENVVKLLIGCGVDANV
jgi:ankyrin repeat protein